MRSALVACAMYEDTWLIYDQHLEDHWTMDPEQQGAIEFRLLRVYRRDCTVHIAGNLSSYPMCPKFEDGYRERQKKGSIYWICW